MTTIGTDDCYQNAIWPVYFEYTDNAESLAIAVNGQSVTFAGADGLDKDVYDVAGRLVALTSGDKLTLAPGLYIVRCADFARRIVVK